MIMNKNIRIRYSGKCPYLNEIKTIEIDFVKFYISEEPAPCYKKLGFVCSNIDECTCCDEYGACPLFNQAPDPR